MDAAVKTKEFSLSTGEYRRIQRRTHLRRNAVFLLFVWLTVAFLVLGGATQAGDRPIWFWLGASGPLLPLALVSTFWILFVAPWRASVSRGSRMLFETHCYRFDADGIHLALRDGSRVSRPYGAILAVEKTPGLILLHQDSGQCFIIPRLAFADSGELDRVLARMGTPGDGASRLPAADAPAPTWIAALARNLWAGLRLAGFRAVRPVDFSASFTQVLLLGLLAVALEIAFGRLDVDGPADFSSYALSEAGTSYLLLAIGAYLLALREGRPALVIPLLVALLSVEPLFAVLFGLSWTQLDLDNGFAVWALVLGMFLWSMAVWWRAVRGLFDVDGARVSAAVALLFAIAVLPQFWLPSSDYWYGTEVESEVEVPERISAEDVFYAQPRMIETALDGLANERPGLVDLYHIGFGSYADQNVFRREVEHVRDILDRRFDTEGRSMLLVNHPSTVEQEPIASVTNLEAALRGVARRMDTDEDVLFLYLTSHGSRRAELQVDFWPLGLNQLSAGGLRRMLDEAGIRWRVVVISACYSGSFMDALTDDHTLAISAASKTTTSFGCSNENEYTYFGEAYFKHGLSQTLSFVDAFDLAQDWVTLREDAESLEHSRPMLHVGSAIAEPLQRLEARLRLQPGATTD